MFKELVKYRDLLYMLTLRDIKIRYKQSVMGFLWAIFMPIVAILAGILIKAAFAFVASMIALLKFRIAWEDDFKNKGIFSISVSRSTQINLFFLFAAESLSAAFIELYHA